jgi:cold shock CspA family protein
MEDIFYNILWIDDEYEMLTGIKGRAKRNSINLIPFKSLNSGMDELERNYPFYDGVLLDAKFLENDDDVKGTEDTYNIHRAKERLLQLKKKFEVFVLTGQAEAYEDKTFQKAFTKVYKKGSDKEIDRLFNEIKAAAIKQEDTQFRHNYKRVFDVCTEKYIGEPAGQDILNLLKVNDEANIENHFNAIRKVVEDLFIAFNKFNLLPVEFIKPNIALNQTSIFLAGQDQHENTNAIYKQNKHLNDTHLPKQIANYLKNILSVTQAGSHRSDIDLYVKTIKTPFLLKSVFFQLLDVLVWFKMYVDSSPKVENWERIETDTVVKPPLSSNLIKGKVISFSIEKGFAFLKPDTNGDNIFIPPHLVTNHSLSNDMEIYVEIEDYIDNRTEETKTRVKRVQIL